MSTITKTIDATAGAWVRVDEGYPAVSMKRALAFTVLYFVGAAMPVTDADVGVQTWTSGSVTIRDLGASQVWVKPVDEDNQIDLLLSNSASLITPQMTSGGNLALTTAGTGTTYTALASQVCKQVTLVNDTGVKVEWRQGGAGVALPIPDGATFSVFGLTNANQISVRRFDTSNTPVTIGARWEA